ncbi:MAG: GntR family transcriptional regulator, partial [Bacteroidaceae bacterium]|nr:GntR family transcriptional regulator [Bacteroidaceae bacterium]
MIKLGDWNELKIKRFTEHGAQLDGGSVGKILMPARYVQRNMRPGQMVTVFVYLDQSDRLVATTETPLARVGDFAFLEVAWVNEHGAFLNWGLMKDLFVPFSEQKMRMEQGRSYLVHIHIDEETHRIVASAKVERYLQEPARKEYYRGRDVEVLLWHKTPLGFKVIVDN